MTFTLKVDCDNAAFEDDPAPELARILREVADGIESGEPRFAGWQGWFQTIHDVNGNDVGRFALKRGGDL